MSLSEEEANAIRASVRAKKQSLDAGPLPAGVIPLEVHCKWSSCHHGRHSLDHFRTTVGGKSKHPPGHCQDCGKKIVELPMPETGAPVDHAQFMGVFAKFPTELIRAHYWNVPFDLRAYNQALRLGRRGLMAKARKQVLEAMLKNDAFAGRRAPYNENVVAYAQHAVAGCCRKCAAYWHGLPLDMNVRPSDEQLDFVVGLVQAYLELRFPNLPDDPTFGVPGVPKNAGPDEGELGQMEENLLTAFAADRDPAGLVIPTRSTIKIISRSDADGGFLEPTNIALPIPRVAS
jgi:hypothetical protein